MSPKKLIFIIPLFLLILTCFRLPWLALSLAEPPFEAERGVLDLHEWILEDNEIIPLNGEWEFYPSSFLAPDSLTHSTDKTTIIVPSNWTPYFPEGIADSDTYATYRLRILVTDEQKWQQFKLRLPHGPFVSKVFVNGRNVLENDATDNTRNIQIRSPISRSATFRANNNNEIDIVMHVPANTMFTKNGIQKAIQFGDATAIDNRYILSASMQFLVVVIALLHTTYSLIIFLMSRSQRVFIHFGLMAFCAALAVLLDDDRLLLTWVHLDYVRATKLTLLAYIGIAAFSLLFTQHFFSTYKNNTFAGILTKLLAFFALLLIFIPLPYTALLTMVSIVTIMITFATIAIFMWRTVKKGEPNVLFLVLAATSVVSSFIWAWYKSYSTTELPFFPVEIIAAFLSFSAFLFTRFFKMSNENKQLAIQLQREVKQKDDFLTNTSHELRNPLHGIINIAQSVLDTSAKQLDDKSKKNVELVVTIGRHMSQTLKDLLDITRLKEHRIQLQQQHLDIQEVASGVIDMLALMLENKNIQLTAHIPTDFPNVFADKNRLIQILFNLLHNAIKFTDRGVISISAEVHESMAVIRITDTGIGMDTDTQSRIFQPYEQVNSSSTVTDGGLGLGLSICQQLVHLHGGTLTVESIINNGSQFTFTLPLSDNNMEPNSQPTQPTAIAFNTEPFANYVAIEKLAPSPSRLYKPKILAVDDNPINVQVLSNILSSEHYEVETVTNGKEALQRLDAKEWDLIITDVMMPHMSGYELTRTIRQKHSISELPILLLTARSQSVDVYTGFLAGANDYITKPVDALELRVRVRVRVHALTDLKESINERLHMEAAWLQAQIQPHFLFNTLNTIISLSEIDTTRMALLLAKFGQYLRKSFDFKKWSVSSHLPVNSNWWKLTYTLKKNALAIGYKSSGI